jgi:hypothetical protein
MVTRLSPLEKFVSHGKESNFHGKLGSIMEFLIIGTHGPHGFFGLGLHNLGKLSWGRHY